jgi:hypothetical protein
MLIKEYYINTQIMADKEIVSDADIEYDFDTDTEKEEEEDKILDDADDISSERMSPEKLKKFLSMLISMPTKSKQTLFKNIEKNNQINTFGKEFYEMSKERYLKLMSKK